MNIARIIFSILFIVFLAAGCSTPKPTPDPLAGWREIVRDIDMPNKAVIDDYQSYILSLTQEEQKSYPTLPGFYADGTGQHAIRFNVNMNGASWAHVLIYDKDNKRIKVIKYFYAYYGC